MKLFPKLFPKVLPNLADRVVRKIKPRQGFAAPAWSVSILQLCTYSLYLRMSLYCSLLSYSSRSSSKEIFSESILRNSSGSSSVRKVRLRSLAMRRAAPLATK